MKPTLRSSLCLAALVSLAGPAGAAVAFLNGYSGTPAEVFSTTQFTYAADVSSSDLINGMTPTVVIGDWNTTNNAHPNEMTDGIHGIGYNIITTDKVQGAWTKTNVSAATYNIGLGAHNLGYDITSIQSIADWVNVGFGNQAWTLAVQPVGGSFVNVATVNYQPLINPVANDNIGTTKVTLTDLDITGIQSLRVTSISVNGGANAGAFVWRELDVFGAATVPEPSAAVLLGLGGLALLRRRRA